MTNQEMLDALIAYAEKEVTTSVYTLYTNGSNFYEYTSEITCDNFLSVLLGGIFLRKEEIVIPFIPFLKFNHSFEFQAIVSTYCAYLSTHHDDLVSLLNNNVEILKPFSVTNKEIYSLVKNIIPNMIQEFYYIFKDSMDQPGSIINKKHSVTYDIDLNQLIDKVSIPNFNLVAIKLLNSFSEFDNDRLLFNELQIENLLCDYKTNELFVNINFINVQNDKLIDSFMNNYIEHFINEFDHFDHILKEDLKKIISYTKVTQNLPDNEHLNKIKVKI